MCVKRRNLCTTINGHTSKTSWRLNLTPSLTLASAGSIAAVNAQTCSNITEMPSLWNLTLACPELSTMNRLLNSAPGWIGSYTKWLLVCKGVNCNTAERTLFLPTNAVSVAPGAGQHVCCQLLSHGLMPIGPQAPAWADRDAQLSSYALPSYAAPHGPPNQPKANIGPNSPRILPLLCQMGANPEHVWPQARQARGAAPPSPTHRTAAPVPTTHWCNRYRTSCSEQTTYITTCLSLAPAKTPAHAPSPLPAPRPLQSQCLPPFRYQRCTCAVISSLCCTVPYDMFSSTPVSL